MKYIASLSIIALTLGLIGCGGRYKSGKNERKSRDMPSDVSGDYKVTVVRSDSSVCTISKPEIDGVCTLRVENGRAYIDVPAIGNDLEGEVQESVISAAAAYPLGGTGARNVETTWTWNGTGFEVSFKAIEGSVGGSNTCAFAASGTAYRL